MYIGLPQINPLFDRAATDEINNAFRHLDQMANELNPSLLEPQRKISTVNLFAATLAPFQKWTYDKSPLGIREIVDLDENATSVISIVKNDSFRNGDEVVVSLVFTMSESVVIPNAVHFFDITESNDSDFFCSIVSSENDIPNCNARIKDGKVYARGRFLSGYNYILQTSFMV